MGGVAVSSVADVSSKEPTTKFLANDSGERLRSSNQPTHGTILPK
jgi:hypothetical protein